MKSIMDDCRQVDAGRWEICEGIRVIGYFESDVINPTLPPMLEADTADTIN